MATAVTATATASATTASNATATTTTAIIATESNGRTVAVIGRAVITAAIVNIIGIAGCIRCGTIAIAWTITIARTIAPIIA